MIKQKNNKPYRIPYQGSKQAIIGKIYTAINNDIRNTNCLFAENKITKIYDLFCGGGAVGYYFNQQGYDVVMNDIKQPLIDLHKKLQDGIDNELLYKWIDREEFRELIKRQDWYGELIRVCWSFGNNGKSYLFGKDIEGYKKQGHLIVVNKCQDAGRKWLEMIGKSNDWENFNKVYNIENQKERRLFLRGYVKKNTDKKNDRGLEQLQQLQQLQRLEQLQQHSITFTCKNYWEFEFEPNSIIYCDPPYINTTGYGKQIFDFNRFDLWVDEMKNKNIRVYISEYTNHNNAWREVASFNKASLMSNYLAVKTIKQEKVFCNI